jgi:CheY-like chemotaxis protein
MINILMADDDEGDTILAREAFRGAGLEHELFIVHDGLKATEFLKQEGEYSAAPIPDLIFLDLNMPSMNGHEVLQWIKKQDALKSIPVVILTTSSTHKDIKASYENAANCFITKPVDLQQFREAINSTSEFWFKTAKIPSKK